MRTLSFLKTLPILLTTAGLTWADPLEVHVGYDPLKATQGVTLERDGQRWQVTNEVQVSALKLLAGHRVTVDGTIDEARVTVHSLISPSLVEHSALLVHAGTADRPTRIEVGGHVVVAKGPGEYVLRALPAGGQVRLKGYLLEKEGTFVVVSVRARVKVDAQLQERLGLGGPLVWTRTVHQAREGEVVWVGAPAAVPGRYYVQPDSGRPGFVALDKLELAQHAPYVPSAGASPGLAGTIGVVR